MCDKQCKTPGHEKAKPELQLMEGGTHYGRWNCGICSKFIVWAKTPKVTEEMEIRQGKIRLVLREQILRMGERELGAICEMYTARTLSMGQLKTWTEMEKRMGLEK